MKNIILAFFAFIALASCATQVGKSSKQEVVTNTKWTLADQVLGSKTPTLNIEDKRISGNGGCNNFFAKQVIPFLLTCSPISQQYCPYPYYLSISSNISI